MSKISAVIVDDEYANRELIRSLITGLSPDYEIVAEASGIEEAFMQVTRLKPLVVFLDIKMPDGTGFDFLRKFTRIDFEVVFISGFDEYAHKAFEYNALDYVLKPVNLNKFKDMLARVENRISNNVKYFANLHEILQSYHVNDTVIVKIPIHHKDRVLLLDVDDIAYVKADEGNTVFYMSKNERYFSAKKLSTFAFILESFPFFLKISRGSYVNINTIVSYSKGMLSYITLKDGSVHELPRRKKTEILEILSAIKGEKYEE